MRGVDIVAEHLQPRLDPHPTQEALLRDRAAAPAPPPPKAGREKPSRPENIYIRQSAWVPSPSLETVSDSGFSVCVVGSNHGSLCQTYTYTYKHICAHVSMLTICTYPSISTLPLVGSSFGGCLVRKPAMCPKLTSAVRSAVPGWSNTWTCARGISVSGCFRGGVQHQNGDRGDARARSNRHWNDTQFQ